MELYNEVKLLVNNLIEDCDKVYLKNHYPATKRVKENIALLRKLLPKLRQDVYVLRKQLYLERKERKKIRREGYKQKKLEKND